MALAALVIIVIHTGIYFALTGPISTARMGERGPVLPERYLPSCEVTDVLGPLGQQAARSIIEPSRTLSLPAVVSAQGLSGMVTLGLIVDASGKVTRSCVRDASGNTDFDSAIWADSLTWRFKPGTADGKPAAFRLDLPISVKPPVKASGEER